MENSIVWKETPFFWWIDVFFGRQLSLSETKLSFLKENYQIQKKNYPFRLKIVSLWKETLMD